MLLGIGLILSAILLLQLDRQGRSPGPVGRVLSVVVSPLHDAVVQAASGIRGWWDGYVAVLDLREEHEALKSELKRLRSTLAEVDELRAENERLRGLLQLGDRRKDLRLRAARVVSRTTSAYFRVIRITLDVSGEGVDIEEGMPVIAEGGVVGQVRTVNGDRAEVMLVTDPRSAIDVVLEKSKARGIAVGTGEADRYAARLEYLERNIETVHGERVVTTGDDGRYPRGLVVGEVADVNRTRHGMFQEAVARPMVDLSDLDEVFVVLGPTGLTPDGSELAPPEPEEDSP